MAQPAICLLPGGTALTARGCQGWGGGSALTAPVVVLLPAGALAAAGLSQDFALPPAQGVPGLAPGDALAAVPQSDPADARVAALHSVLGGASDCVPADALEDAPGDALVAVPRPLQEFAQSPAPAQLGLDLHDTPC